MGIESSKNATDLPERDISEARILVPVPAKNEDLYRYSVTNNLLSFLIDRPFEEYTLRKLASLLGTTHRSVSLAVDVLEDNDLVVVTPKGNKKLVGINRERVETPENDVLRVPQSEFQRPVQEAIDALADQLEGVLGIVVYGSVARGEADRQSDIDLWVLTGDRAEQHKANEIAKELGEERFDGDRYEFQILVESLESARGHSNRLEDVFADAITLADSDELRDLKQEVLGNA
jgi:predicted nucleotidyltransferase